MCSLGPVQKREAIPSDSPSNFPLFVAFGGDSNKNPKRFLLPNISMDLYFGMEEARRLFKPR